MHEIENIRGKKWGSPESGTVRPAAIGQDRKHKMKIKQHESKSLPYWFLAQAAHCECSCTCTDE